MVLSARAMVTLSGVACAVLLAAGEARAYCRTTTCDPRKGDCPRDANGCVRAGAPLSFRTLPLTYRFDAAGSAKLDMDRAREAVRAAFATWSNVQCGGARTSLRFVEGPEIRGGGAPGRAPFGIYFRDDAWPYDDADESLALTNQSYGAIDGYVDDADIEVNTSEEIFSVDDGGGFDLQAVVTHEVGHFIGLAHSRVPDSIMVARYCQSDRRCGGDADAARALADDDVRAVCALYPPSGIAGVRYAEPSSGCSASPAPSAAGASSFAVGALILGAFARRRRARG